MDIFIKINVTIKFSYQNCCFFKNFKFYIFSKYFWYNKSNDDSFIKVVVIIFQSIFINIYKN